MATALPVPRWRQALSSGVSLVTVTIVASNVLRILSTIVLTRVLAPADFGVVGVTAAILAVMSMISDFGFAVYVIQHPRGDDRHLLDAVWTARLIRSAMLTLILFALSGPIAMLIDKPTMYAAIAVTSLQFVVEGCSSLTSMTMIRQQKLLVLSLLDIICAVAQTMMGIILAFILRDYWAIVIAGLLGTAVRSVLSYTMFADSGRRFAFDLKEIGELWRFGRTIAGAHTIQVLLSNVDKFVLSRIFPLGMFGLYTLASNLAGAPSAFTMVYPSRILLPEFARANREGAAELAGAYYGSRRTVMLLYMLAMGGFIGLAPGVVNLLYDPRYASAASYLRLLSIAPAIALNNYAAREVLIVAGRVKTLLFANIVRLGWLLVFGTAGFVVFGPMGLVAAVGLVEVPVLLYCWFELDRIDVFRLREELLMLGALGIGVALGFIADGLYFSLIARP